MPTGHYKRKPRVERISVTCKTCGKIFQLTPGQYRTRGEPQFCSQKCNGLSRANPNTFARVECSQCGKSFMKPINRVAEHNFCSVECVRDFKYGADRGLREKCRHCGTKTPRRSAVYCSRACAAAALRNPNANWNTPEYKREYMTKYARAWRQDNRERILARNRERHLIDPTKRNAAMVRRRARVKNLPDAFTSADWQYCLSYWQNRCVMCGSKDRISADHWIAVSHRNSPGTVRSNMIPLCCNCNSSKSNRNPVDWLYWRFSEEEAMLRLVEVEAYFRQVVTR